MIMRIRDVVSSETARYLSETSYGKTRSIRKKRTERAFLRLYKNVVSEIKAGNGRLSVQAVRDYGNEVDQRYLVALFESKGYSINMFPSPEGTVIVIGWD
jgi:DNA-binding FadR family transcriptional regulator